MRPRARTRLVAAVFALSLATQALQSQSVSAPEKLDRGLVAVRTGDNAVYLGWRLLSADASTVGFDVYRSTDGGRAVKLTDTPVTRSTNFVDTTAAAGREHGWWLRAVVGGKEAAPQIARISIRPSSAASCSNKETP